MTRKSRTRIDRDRTEAETRRSIAEHTSVQRVASELRAEYPDLLPAEIHAKVVAMTPDEREALLIRMTERSNNTVIA